jgi:hypothetical protein
MADGSIGPIRTIATGAAIRGNIQAPAWIAPDYETAIRVAYRPASDTGKGCLGRDQATYATGQRDAECRLPLFEELPRPQSAC